MTQFDPLRERVKEILLHAWDPIGVRDVENAQDEYDAYVLAVVSSILARKTAAQLRDQLMAIEVDLMGLAGDKNRASSVATELAKL
jgi:hypothetical protein